MEFLTEYGLFLAKAITIVIAIVAIMSVVVANREHMKDRGQGKIKVTNLNDRYDAMRDSLLAAVLDPAELKWQHKQKQKEEKHAAKEKHKALKAAHKAEKKSGKDKPVVDAGADHQPQLQAEADAEAGDSTEVAGGKEGRRVFVVKFNGDIKASALANLREEITTILKVADKDDEVVVCLESPGGMVANYGLAASQLTRVHKAGIPLTIAVDKVAASGGYMMACVGDKVLAAPFAMLGSIGVVAQIPNFNRLLKRNDIDIELMTAGEYKRTLTMFGENTSEGRQKFQEDIDDIHRLFQHFISEYRPSLDVNRVATGEVWFGKEAQDLGLIDGIQTSDEYLTNCAENHDLYLVEYKHRHLLPQKLAAATQNIVEGALSRVLTRLEALRHHAQ
ncbi:protease SohB [Biformimicrobium ophioploci]|uniref:Protease SohB n=1 Tax=Biformimicrobium ophioploci TaxID=3036711 RepID=A0ABQ6M2Z4_9GAMM|nr:protease SohB [Microbulbifer sp. NKW57]GMG88696.1 protease SohB [Microbulbifer sp. NKW57]